MKKKTDIDRRQFIISSTVAVTSIAAVTAGLKYFDSANIDKDGKRYLRPPGAIDEKDFIYGCIKCGLCVQICPIGAIKLADLDTGLNYGTPYLEVREQACDFSCDALQCIETCPTAVLDFIPFKHVGDEAAFDIEKKIQSGELKREEVNPLKIQSAAMKRNVKMGIAKLNAETCLAVRGEGFRGKPRGDNFKGVYRLPDGSELQAKPLIDRTYDREICDLCVTECPIGDIAIRMDNTSGQMIPVVLDGCTGCGVCEMICPNSEPSIIVEPLKA